MKTKEHLTTSSPPLEVILQQCHDDDHMSPINNEQAWLDCLQDVYVGQSYQPTLGDLAAAIDKVWKDELTKNTFSDALSYFKNASGGKAFDNNAITIQIEMFFGTDCLILNGYKSFVACGNNQSLRFEGTSPFSLLIWLKPTTSSGGQVMGRLDIDPWTGPLGGYAMWMAPTSPVGAFMGCCWAYRSADPYLHCVAKCDFGVGQKYFLANTFDGTTSKLYTDGQEKAWTNYNAPMIPASDEAQFVIGSCYLGSPRTYEHSLPANIARAAVFNIALSQDFLQTLTTTVLTGKEDNLVAYWDFTKKSAIDLSGNGNHGTLVGDATFGPGY